MLGGWEPSIVERRVVEWAVGRGVGGDEQDAIVAATTMTLLIAAYGLDIVLLLLQCLRPVHLILVPFRFGKWW